MHSALRKAAGMDTESQASEENCCQFLVGMMKKFYPVTRLKFYQSLNMKLPNLCARIGAGRFSIFLLQLVLTDFLYSCYKLIAGKKRKPDDVQVILSLTSETPSVA